MSWSIAAAASELERWSCRDVAGAKGHRTGDAAMQLEPFTRGKGAGAIELGQWSCRNEIGPSKL